MNPNLTTSYLALQAERDRLPAQAERGWEAEQAIEARPLWAFAAGLRQRFGAALIAAEGRLQRRARDMSLDSPEVTNPTVVSR
jgi:hypothetical protein